MKGKTTPTGGNADLTQDLGRLAVQNGSPRASKEEKGRGQEDWLQHPLVQAFFNQPMVGVAVLDSKGDIQASNRAFSDLLGYTPEELSHRRWTEIILPADRAGVDEQWRRLETSPTGSRVMECQYVRSSGDTVWGSTVLSCIQGRNLKPQGVALFVSDASDKKKMAEERNQLEEQLLRAQKLGSLGMLAGGLAHDFNNFLEVILGFASLARLRLPSDGEILEPLRMIEESANRAAHLTAQLLEITSDEKSPQEPADPARIIDRVVKIVSRTFDRQIRVEQRLEADLPYVRGSGQRFEQAILNLAVNARDAMPEGGTLTIGASRARITSDQARRRSDHPGDYVQILVEDTGFGMEPEVLQRIFDPLFTTKSAGEGSGLGLAMVHKIVTDAGGFIKVESKPGEGSCFRLYLPVTQVSRPMLVPSVTPTLVRGRGTILVVDDEPMVISFVKKGLQHLGYKVLIARSGQQACDLYAAYRDEIECVILDMIMPEMSGLETHARLKTLNPDVKVILSSGYSQRGLGAGLPQADFLGKPYSIQSLSLALKKIREQ